MNSPNSCEHVVEENTEIQTTVTIIVSSSLTKMNEKCATGRKERFMSKRKKQESE